MPDTPTVAPLVFMIAAKGQCLEIWSNAFRYEKAGKTKHSDPGVRRSSPFRSLSSVPQQ